MAVTEEKIKNRSAANRMLMIEAIIIILCGLLFIVFASLEFAYSVILGGLAFIVPNAVFVKIVLHTSATDSSSRVLTWFYVGEAIKIVTTIIIFALGFAFVKPLHVVTIFATYIMIMIVNLAGLAILSKTEQII